MTFMFFTYSVHFTAITYMFYVEKTHFMQRNLAFCEQKHKLLR